MKNTEKEIIERFQKFDFDPNQAAQSKVFDKITNKTKKGLSFNARFVMATAFCAMLVAAAGILSVRTYTPATYGIKRKVIANTQIVEDKNYSAQARQEYADAEYTAQAPQYKPAKHMQARPASSANMMKTAGKEQAVSMPAQVSFREPPSMLIRSEEHRAVAKYSVSAAYDMDYNAMQDESYKKYEENTFRSTATDPLSTFSADVDTASYGIVKKDILAGRSVNPDSVRIEEFINYFDYDYPQPQGKEPVSINFEYTDSPWNEGLKLVKIGIKAKDIEKEKLPPANLVFLVDVSGSMSGENRLPLVKKSLKMLVEQLRPQDRISLITYADGEREVLSGAKGSEKHKINAAIDALIARGGTNGSAGLAMAYKAAKENFIRKGSNRIILATDGDFNIGPRSESELENQITEARKSGVFLSVLGYGMGNYKDSMVQTLANKGNGNYAYVNNLEEANKVIIKEFGSTLFTLAKDVKLQVEFNPAKVAAYRLIGYEKRRLENQDFNDDTKDAGEMGAGHTVTVVYEIIPAGLKSKYLPDTDSLKYGKAAASDASGEVLTLKLRYKEPEGDASKLMQKVLEEKSFVKFEEASADMRFAASVIQFGQIIKDSPFKGSMDLDNIIKTAKKAKGEDDNGYRAEFIKAVEIYKATDTLRN